MSEIIQKMYASGGGTPLRVIRIKNADLPNGYLAYAQAYEDVEFFALLFDTNFLDGISYTWGAAYVCKNGFGGETIGNSFDYVNN